MEALFLKLFNMSITASWLILAVILLRFILKKAPKFTRLILWGLVALRLICPFSFESVLSLIPSTETVPAEILYSPSPEINSGIEALNTTINPVISNSLSPEIGASTNPLQIITFIAAIIWLIGLAAILLYAVISYIRVAIRIKESLLLKDNIYLCDRISTPFIFGLIKPKIYLPSSVNNKDAEYVVAHEKSHLKRFDHRIKPIGFILLSVYWFNPLVWIAYVLFCRDIEFACDEKVINSLGIENKKPYSNALINCSSNVKSLAVCPLAFGEVSVKARIKSVLNYKKPAFWTVIAAVLLCIAVALCFLTNPKSNKVDNAITTASGSDLENVFISLTSYDFTGETPYIEISWYNETQNDIVYGEEFYIYKIVDGEYKDCRTTSYVFDAIGYYLSPGGESTKKYSLENLSLRETGKYIFKTECFIEGEATDGYNIPKYDLWIEFELRDKDATFVWVNNPTLSFTMQHRLSSDEKNVLTDILDKNNWKDGTTNYTEDYYLNFEDGTYKYLSYHSESGTFNDEENNRHLTVSATEKEMLNKIFNKYVQKPTSSVSKTSSKISSNTVSKPTSSDFRDNSDNTSNESVNTSSSSDSSNTTSSEATWVFNVADLPPAEPISDMSKEEVTKLLAELTYLDLPASLSDYSGSITYTYNPEFMILPGSNARNTIKYNILCTVEDSQLKEIINLVDSKYSSTTYGSSPDNTDLEQRFIHYSTAKKYFYDETGTEHTVRSTDYQWVVISKDSNTALYTVNFYGTQNNECYKSGNITINIDGSGTAE